jgi:hypothetical protein
MIKTELSPFNSPLETGIRTLVILLSSYPKSVDLQKLVDFDYLVVHSSDVGGPDSLHPSLPLRAGELLVRRRIIESGIMLMMSRGLIERLIKNDGIEYIASDNAMPFIDSLTSTYIYKLRNRAEWIASIFGEMSSDNVQEITSQFFNKWNTHFQSSSIVRE